MQRKRCWNKENTIEYLSACEPDRILPSNYNPDHQLTFYLLCHFGNLTAQLTHSLTVKHILVECTGVSAICNEYTVVVSLMEDLVENVKYKTLPISSKKPVVMISYNFIISLLFSFNGCDDIQWLKWSCEAWSSPDEARLEQTPYPFHTQLIWHYLGIK